MTLFQTVLSESVDTTVWNWVHLNCFIEPTHSHFIGSRWNQIENCISMLNLNSWSEFSWQQGRKKPPPPSDFRLDSKKGHLLFARVCPFGKSWNYFTGWQVKFQTLELFNGIDGCAWEYLKVEWDISSCWN